MTDLGGFKVVRWCFVVISWAVLKDSSGFWAFFGGFGRIQSDPGKFWRILRDVMDFFLRISVDSERFWDVSCQFNEPFQKILGGFEDFWTDLGGLKVVLRCFMTIRWAILKDSSRFFEVWGVFFVDWGRFRAILRCFLSIGWTILKDSSGFLKHLWETWETFEAYEGLEVHFRCLKSTLKRLSNDSSWFLDESLVLWNNSCKDFMDLFKLMIF